MNQIAKEYFLTLLAFPILLGGTMFSLVFFKPAGIPWETLNDIMTILGIGISIIFYLLLLNKRDKSIDSRIKINSNGA